MGEWDDAGNIQAHPDYILEILILRVVNTKGRMTINSVEVDLDALATSQPIKNFIFWDLNLGENEIVIYLELCTIWKMLSIKVH